MRKAYGIPGYVFQLLAGGTLSVCFYGERDDVSAMEITAPTITSVRDINDNYSAVNPEEVAILLSNAEYTGNCTLILNKLTHCTP